MSFSASSSFYEPISLRTLLPRMQSKIESRTRRPWYDLQRSYYFKSKSGIASIAELSAALQHFHVSLSSSELDFLYKSYPTPSGGFDFRSFAAALYPKDEEPQSVLIAKDGLSERREQLEKASKLNSPVNASAAATAQQHDEDYVVVNHSDAPATEANAPAQPQAQTQSQTQKAKKITGKKSGKMTGRLTFGTKSPVLSSSLRQPVVKRYNEVQPAPYPPQEFMSHGKYTSTAVNPRFSLKRK